MNCPKCGEKVKETDLFCPKCKKALKLKCPQCSTISKKNICPECDFIMLSKCYKCGKLNPSDFSNCTKCGMSIVASLALKEATIDEFAVVNIEITNFDIIKKLFDSRKVLKQFKENLYSIIKNYAVDKKVRVQEINNVLIIRFCKDDSFKLSCKSAVDFSLHIAQFMTEINKKLHEIKKVYLKVKMGISMSDISDENTYFEAGRNIEVKFDSETIKEIYKNVQIIVDSKIYKATKSKYPYKTLGSVFVKDEMQTFFEIMINKVLKEEDPEDELGKSFDLSGSIDFEVEEDQTDEHPAIELSEKKCTFVKIKPDELTEYVINTVNSGISNPIIKVKGNYRTGKLNNLNKSALAVALADTNIISLKCTEDDQFYPYAFFRNIIKAYLKINELDILLNENLNELNGKISGYNPALKEFLFLNSSNISNPDELRYKFFDAIKDFFSFINNKTLFIIDDFEFIDRGSIDIFKYLLDTNSLGQVSFVFSANQEFYFHKQIYKLINRENYHEVELKLRSNKSILALYGKQMKNVGKTFFVRKILENTKGSLFYFQQAIDHLVENDVFILSEGKYEIGENKMLVIPPGIKEFAKKRISHYLKDEKAFNILASLLLLNGEAHESMLQCLNIEDFAQKLVKLEKGNFITISESRMININNYNLYKEALLTVVDKDKLNNVAKTLIDILFQGKVVSHPITANLNELANSKRETLTSWSQLGDIALSTGDFAAYINCSAKFLTFVENSIEENQENQDQSASDEDTGKENSAIMIKFEIYEQTSQLLYKYYPDKVYDYLKTLIEMAEEAEESKKVKNLSNIMVQSCLLNGDYRNALEYIGKVISRTPTGSFNPASKDFNINFYLTNLVTIEIFFNLGKFSECIDLGDEIFQSIKNLDMKTVLPKDFSIKRFKDVMRETQILVSIARIIQLKEDSSLRIKDLVAFYSEDSGCFEKILEIYELVLGNNSESSNKSLSMKNAGNDPQSKTIYLISKMLEHIQNKDWQEAGNTAHFAKKFAHETKGYQISYFLDLIIGFAYKEIGNYKKANKIYYDVLQISNEKNMMGIMLMSWYLIADLEFAQGNVDISLGILNNALSTIEKAGNISNLFTMYYKILLSKVFFSLGNFENALYCANQGYTISSKYNLKDKKSYSAQILIEIYKNLSQAEKNKGKVANYQQKINELSLGLK